MPATKTERLPAPGTPTQVAHPWKAVLRTVVAFLVSSVVAWLAHRGIDLADLEDAIVSSLTFGVWTLVLGFVQWLLSHPRVLPILTRLGLGTGVETEAGR